MIPRTINLENLIKSKSCFLFGPRSAGKTYLIRQLTVPKIFVINLLKSEIFLRLQAHPEQLEQLIVEAKCSTVVIDEVQKLPILLNEVHRLIEERGLKFLLTGSSARKLKKEKANMLGGRASVAHIFPLTWKELDTAKKFELSRAMRYGTLPKIYLASNPEQELFDYIDSYLREEIQAEAVVRNLPTFTKFLSFSALANAEIINYSNIASDLGISVNSVKEYYQILEDTLVGFRLPPWKQGSKRKTVAMAKHYYVDLGIVRTLCSLEDAAATGTFDGKLFENFMINEVRAFISYRRLRKEIHFWRTDVGDEVDLIIGKNIAVEFKYSKSVHERDSRGLVKLQEEGSFRHRLLVSRDPQDRELPSGIRCLHWESFLRKLWNDELIT